MSGPDTAHPPEAPEEKQMGDDMRWRVTRILLQHTGGWIDNGGLDAHCQCGHRGELGEFHAAHVADALLASMFIPAGGPGKLT